MHFLCDLNTNLHPSHPLKRTFFPSCPRCSLLDLSPGIVPLLLNSPNKTLLYTQTSDNRSTSCSLFPALSITQYTGWKPKTNSAPVHNSHVSSCVFPGEDFLWEAELCLPTPLTQTLWTAVSKEYGNGEGGARLGWRWFVERPRNPGSRSALVSQTNRYVLKFRAGGYQRRV